MNCSLCNRPLRKNVKSRMKHFIKHHPERVSKVLDCILENPFRFGLELADYVVNQPTAVHQTLKGLQ